MKGIFTILNYYFSPGRWAAQWPLTTAPAAVGDRNLHHAAHICKTCAALPPEKQAEEMALTRLVNLPWRLSKEQLSWLKKRMKDRRDAVRTLATEQYEMRFPPRIELDELEDDFEEDFDFYMDEETDIE